MMNQKITYGFVLKPNLNKMGLHPVYFRAFQSGRKIEIATSVTLTGKDWSVNLQRVKRRNRLHERYNTILEAYDKKAMKLLVNSFVQNETALTLQQFKDQMISATYEDGNFTDYILNYLNENRPRLRLESWFSYKSQITKLLKFKKKVMFSDITEKFINDYHSYMIHTLCNNENTASKSLRSLRTFVNIALRYKYMKINPFQFITIKKVDGKRDFLNPEELGKLSKAYFSGEVTKPIEKQVLQYFLFSCYTGLRYSDLKSLQANAISDNKVKIKMHKTGYLVTIPLTQKATQLLPATLGSGTQPVFRIYCNKVTNRILKQIGKRFDIPKKLTCHVARHTFATVSITLGIPIEVVSKLLGHTNLRTTQVYAKIVDNVKEREMLKWDLL
ncbi:site-specific integrase [Parafilimonas sp.]|uniref:site-specific integrase n=1 Tax=Parafilimonas sp. TaxID=1969739 RepID=UPI0039E31F7B